MIKRLNRWFLYLWCRYIPSSRKIVSLESKRLALFIAENYDFSQYPIVLEGIRTELLKHTKSESINRIEDITITQKELELIGDVTNLLDDSKILTKK